MELFNNTFLLSRNGCYFNQLFKRLKSVIVTNWSCIFTRYLWKILMIFSTCSFPSSPQALC